MAELSFIPASVCDALLFFSRARVPAHDSDKARALCATVEDWPLLINIAARKFSLPFVYSNLKELDMGADLADVLEQMHRVVLLNTFAALRVLQAQRTFHRDCIEPLNVPHVYLKGPTLAMRYYDDPGQRFARDIDVLVSREDQEKIARHSLKRGYLILDETAQKGRAFSDRDLHALLTYKTVVTLVSPDDVIIEVHRDVDKRLGVFRPADMLDRREYLRADGLRYDVMPISDLFCYVCYHNTRHIWSRLHWIADLDALITHSSFEPDQVLARAGELGLRANVEACLELHKMAISGHFSAQAAGEGRGAELARICLKNLAGDLELEYALREDEELIGLPFTWMVSRDVRRRARTQTQLDRILPGYEEYEAWPLPRALQWLYYISKPLGIAKRHFLGSPERDANP